MANTAYVDYRFAEKIVCENCYKNQALALIEYFEYKHLPEHLQAVSKAFGDVAQYANQKLPDGPEKVTGLRKLLEAKDCMVRAAICK